MKKHTDIAGANEITIRFALQSDLRTIARIHRLQFANHFLGQYPEALIERFYSCFLGRTVFLCATVDRQIAGFVLGADDGTISACRRSFIATYWPSMLVATLVRPKLWRDVARRIPVILPKKKQSEEVHSEAAWRLLSIAVSEEAKGKGIADLLLASIEAELPSISSYGLSVHDDNSRAIAFYRRSGFAEEGRSRNLVFFIKELEKTESGS